MRLQLSDMAKEKHSETNRVWGWTGLKSCNCGAFVRVQWKLSVSQSAAQDEKVTHTSKSWQIDGKKNKKKPHAFANVTANCTWIQLLLSHFIFRKTGCETFQLRSSTLIEGAVKKIGKNENFQFGLDLSKFDCAHHAFNYVQPYNKTKFQTN